MLSSVDEHKRENGVVFPGAAADDAGEYVQRFVEEGSPYELFAGLVVQGFFIEVAVEELHGPRCGRPGPVRVVFKKRLIGAGGNEHIVAPYGAVLKGDFQGPMAPEILGVDIETFVDKGLDEFVHVSFHGGVEKTVAPVRYAMCRHR